jgi:HAD superfamily hydrolase (TIGR01509 family)
MTSFQAVFFDMDGTFVNSEPHWLAAETELMSEFGHEWDLKDQQFCLGGPLDKVGRYMSELAGGVNSPDWFRLELIKRTMQHVRTSVEFMPGAIELLLELKSINIPVGLVTASPAEMMDATLDAMKEKYFDIAISGSDVKVTKPDPEGYFLAADRLGVDIENSIVLEDSLTGITAAKASGAFVIAIPHIVKIEPAPRVAIVDSLNIVNFSKLKSMFVPKKNGVVL